MSDQRCKSSKFAYFSSCMITSVSLQIIKIFVYNSQFRILNAGLLSHSVKARKHISKGRHSPHGNVGLRQEYWQKPSCRSWKSHLPILPRRDISHFQTWEGLPWTFIRQGLLMCMRMKYEQYSATFDEPPPTFVKYLICRCLHDFPFIQVSWVKLYRD